MHKTPETASSRPAPPRHHIWMQGSSTAEPEPCTGDGFRSVPVNIQIAALAKLMGAGVQPTSAISISFRTWISL
jgi:hypothetical protein